MQDQNNIKELCKRRAQLLNKKNLTPAEAQEIDALEIELGEMVHRRMPPLRPDLQVALDALKEPGKREAIMKLPYRKVEETPFRIEPGRYFYAMFYYPFPPCDDHLLGGNVTGLIWHLDDEPESWRVSYRYRYYNSMKVECTASGESTDEFSWYALHTPGLTPEQLLVLMQATLVHSRPLAFGDVAPNEPDKWEVLKIEGDSVEYFKKAYSAKLSWLSIRRVSAEQYEKITGEKLPTI